MFDRLPPSDDASERGAIGCCLLDRNALNEAIGLIPSPEVFYTLRNRKIWDVLCEMAEDCTAIDLITVWARLGDQLNAVGGRSYVSSLPDQVPSAAHLEHYVKILLEHYQRRKLLAVCTEFIGKAYECDDANELLDQFETQALAVRHGHSDSLHPCGATVNRVLEKIRAYQEEPEKVQGIATGFHGIDNLTGGLQPGLMYVVAGRTSRGKTSFAVNIAAHVALNLGLPVGIFSLETTADQLLMRLLCSLAKVNSHDIRNGRLNTEDSDRIIAMARQLRKAKLFIDNSPGLPVMRLRARGRRMVQQHGIKLLVIDYLQLVGATYVKGMSREQMVAGISNGIKLLGQELGIPVIVLSQLNRELDKEKERKPRLSDLRESGAIEQDSDVCMLLYSKFTEEEFREMDVVTVNVLIAKNKDGACGEVALDFLKTLTRFQNQGTIDEQDIPERTGDLLPYKD